MSINNQEQIKALEKVLNKLNRKYGELELGLAISSSVSEKFELKEKITECKQEIDRITREIKNIKDSKLLVSISETEPKAISVSKKKITVNRMQLRDRDEIRASVVFFFIPKLGEQAKQDPAISYLALVSLHNILQDKLLNQSNQIRILSSISGAIAIIPDGSNVYIHQMLSIILNDCKSKGLPVRLGITHGILEILKDVDESYSFIGVPMNIAARLSTSEQNKGLLYHSSYKDTVQHLLSSQSQDPLHPKFCQEVEILGKKHDKPFNCHKPNNSNLVLNEFNQDNFPELSSTNIPKDINGAIIIAYDLPEFSLGDRSELSKRFRSVIDSIENIKTSSIFPKESNKFFFSPGGDGGIIILPTKTENPLRDYIDIVFNLIKTLEVESDSKGSNIEVKSRLSAHYGAINLYYNAEGILRPTGLNCFITDEIASDDVAKQKSGVIITEIIKESLYQGSSERFAKEYENLPPLNKGAARGTNRYAKKRTSPS